MYTNFKKLNKQGTAGERLFVDFLVERSYVNIEHIDDVYIKEGLRRSDWDIRCTNDMGVTVTFEVKTQNKCHKHKFVNIEQVQNGKLGGIGVTKADYYVIVNKELGFGIIDTEELKKTHRQIIKVSCKKDYAAKRVVNGVQLWLTKYENYAAGWKMSVHDIDWFTNKKDIECQD